MKRNILSIFIFVTIFTTAIHVAHAKRYEWTMTNVYTPKGYGVKEVEHDWANPDHYLSAEQIINWADSFDPDSNEPYPIRPATGISPRYRGEIQLRTNLAYWLCGVLNAGTEWRFAKSRYAALLDVGYSPFGGENRERSLGGWFISPQLRCYVGIDERWFVGAKAIIGGYNIRTPNISSVGRQGDFIAGGITTGYRIYLSPSFNMDFTAGVGYAAFKFDKYNYTGFKSVKFKSNVKKHSFAPIDIGVNLIWKVAQ